MKRKICLFSILVLIINFILGSISYAANESCKLTLNAEGSDVIPGTTIDVILKVSDINAGDGIAMISGFVEYDETAFEKIEYIPCSNWGKSEVENYIYINTESLEVTKENQDVLKLTLTTKEDVADGTYKVLFKNIEVTTNNDIFTVEDIEVNINIKKVIYGDVNNNGKIDTMDLLKLLRYVAMQNAGKHKDEWDLTEREKRAADVNKDGKINTMDILKMKRYIAASKSTNIVKKYPEWLEI